jgi:hypothetical protein
MADGGVTVKALATATNVCQSSIMDFRKGKSLPRLSTSARISEALASEALHALVISLRERTCPVCARGFVTDNRKKRHCSKACTATNHTRLVRAKDARRSEVRSAANRGLAQLRAYRLEMHQEAVAAHCRWCEPGGLCRTPDCALRPVSPLPLVDDGPFKPKPANDVTAYRLLGGPLDGKEYRATGLPGPMFRTDKHPTGAYWRDGDSLTYRWKATLEVVS